MKVILILFSLLLCLTANNIDEYDENKQFDCYPERGRVDSCKQIDFQSSTNMNINYNSGFSPMIDKVGDDIEGKKFYEWEGVSNPEFEHTDALEGIFTEYGYGSSAENYNEFTPNMTLWEKRYNTKRLTRILSDKSEKLKTNDGMSKMKNFKYYALSHIDNFKGATSNFDALRQKTSNKMKLEVYPRELNFNSVELCSPMYKNFTLKNLDKQKNIEIASIVPESSQISIEHEYGNHILIRPGQRINIKVTVTAELREPIRTVITFTLKNGLKLVYLVKFIGMDNFYELEPMVIDKARHPTNMIDFFMTNPMEEDFEFVLNDIKIKKNSAPAELYHAQYRLNEDVEDRNAVKDPNNPYWYDKFSPSKIKLNKKLRMPIFKININDTGSDYEELVIHFLLKDNSNNEKTYFDVPVYIKFNDNAVDLYPPILDFGVLYSNSGIHHKIQIKAVRDGRKGIRVGFPFVSNNSHFDYDFSPILETHGVVNKANDFTLGTVTLKTLGLQDGDHEGYIIFCKDKVCEGDKGKTRIYYQFKVHKDPLNGVSKMHSFEVSEENTKGHDDKVHIQLLWLKNTFNHALRIDDITCEDKELSLTFGESKNFDEVSEDKHCCLSSLTHEDSHCQGCGKKFIEDLDSTYHKLILNPGSENQGIKMRYRYQINRSKTVEIKFVVVWANGTYIPIPVFIYDKSLACAFEYYNDSENAKVPFIPMATKCNNMPDFRHLDFGPIAEGLNHTRTLTLANLNLMPIFIDKIRIDPPVCNGEVVDMDIRLVPEKAFDIMTLQKKRDYTSESKTFSKLYTPSEINQPQKGHSIVESSDFMMAPNTLVSFSLELQAPSIQPQDPCTHYEATLFFKSSQSPDFQLPISFFLVSGTPTDFYSMMIDLPPLEISERKEVRELNIKSNLEYPMHIMGAKADDEGKIEIEILKRVLQPNEEVKVIRISTLPFNNFDTYLRLLKNHLFEGRKEEVEPVLTYFDILAFQSEKKEWEDRVLMNQTESVTMVDIKTNIVKNISIPIKTVIKKPQLVDFDVYDFGMIEVDTAKRGNIQITNPSSQAIEISLHIAPANYLDMILNELMSDESLIKWMVLCEKITFFNPVGRRMCQDLVKIKLLPEEKLLEVTDFFFKNYFNFISNNDLGEDLFINFISEQQEILKSGVKNISDSTLAIQPEVKDKCAGGCEEENTILSYLEKLNPFAKASEVQKQAIPKVDPMKGEQYEEIVESIKVRLNQWIDEYPQNMSNEFKTLLNTRKQNFFIENPSQCKEEGRNSREYDCHSECNLRKFILLPHTTLNYNCLHFHPTLAVDNAESYLLIKNNLTYVYPIKLRGRSGKAVFKIADVKAPSFYTSDNKQMKFKKVSEKNDKGVDILFNLNMKHDVFRVKNLENLSTKENHRRATESTMGTEKVTVKNIALIRKHYRRFNISNTGNFHTRIQDVTFSNHQKKNKRFTLTKLSGNQGYEIMYEPDFRHSVVEETLLIKTENSVTEFKIQAEIPLYLIKFIDGNFRLTEIEEHIGNWYYLIVLSLVLLTLLLLGTELVEYVIFLKQKNINYTLLTELISAYEKTKELAQEEQKMEKLSKILDGNKAQFASQPSNEEKEKEKMKAKKSTPKKQNPQAKSKTISSDDSKAKIEEIKKKLAGRIDFSEPTPIPEVKEQKIQKNKENKTNQGTKEVERQPLAKHVKGKKKYKGSFIENSRSEAKKDLVNIKARNIKTPKKVRPNKDNKAANSTFDRKASKKEIQPESDDNDMSAFVEVPSRRREEKGSDRNKGSFVKNSTKQKAKAKKEEKKKEVKPEVAKTPKNTVKPEIKKPEAPKPEPKKPTPKPSEFKRGKQRNQPKQNKVKDITIDLSQPQNPPPPAQPHPLFQPVTQINLSNTSEFPSLTSIPTPAPIPPTSTPSEPQNSPSEAPEVPEHPETPSTAIKLFSRSETKESAISEPTQEPRNRLSNAQSNNSWADNEEGDESYNPRSEYTDDDKMDDSQDKIGYKEDREEREEREEMGRSEKSQSDGSYKGSRGSAQKYQEKRYNKNSGFKENRKATSGRHNPYYRNDYSDLKYYKKSYYDSNQYKGAKKGNDNTPKSGSSYQDYKRELREQKHKHKYGSKGYYQKNQQDYYSKPIRGKDEIPSMRRGTRGQYREDKSYKSHYYYDAQEDYSYNKYGHGNYQKPKKSEPKISEDIDEESPSHDHQDQQPSNFLDSQEEVQSYINPQRTQKMPSNPHPQDQNLILFPNYNSEEGKDLIQAPSEPENEEEKASEVQGFFEPKDQYTPAEFNMFSAFQNPGREFSLFSPVDGGFGDDDQANFSLLDDSAEPVQEEDEVLGRFSNLQDLRNQSETINYDLTRKSFKYRSGYSSKSPE